MNANILTLAHKTPRMITKRSHLATKAPKSESDALLTETDVAKLLDACSGRSPSGIRNRAAIAVLAAAGIRVSELVQLRLEDLEAVQIIVRNRDGRRRTLTVDRKTNRHIDEWLQARRKIRIIEKAPVFCTLRGNTVSADYFRQMLPRIARKAGIGKSVNCRLLRRFYAKQLQRKDTSLYLIGMHLGHSSPAVTARYLGVKETALLDEQRQ